MIQAGTVISLCEKVRAVRMDGFTDTQRTLCVITPSVVFLSIKPTSFYPNVVVEADRQH